MSAQCPKKAPRSPRGWWESLETRRLLAAAYPTDLEQYMVELINRARANPAGEATRYGVDLNEGLAAGTISAGARQPLAVNPHLTEAGRKHSQWMLDKDAFGHTGASGTDPIQRMKNAGYSFVAPWTWAENIALRSFKTSAPHPDVIEAIHKDLFVDIGIEGRGHRVNLLAASSREIGVGIASGLFTSFNAAMTTENFASSNGSVYLTGVAYTDAKTPDKFYTPGEGMGGVTVMAVRQGDGASFTTQTWGAGGYSLKLAPGTYKVTASGGALARAISFDAVTVGPDNVKRDFVPGATAGTTPGTGGNTGNPGGSSGNTGNTGNPGNPGGGTGSTGNTGNTGTGGTTGGNTGNQAPKPANPPPAAPPDRTPPSLGLQALRKRKASRYYGFVITFTDPGKVSRASLGNADFQVRGRNGFVRDVVLEAADKSADSATIRATYVALGPDKRWDRSDNGIYSIWSKSNQVKDAAGNALAATKVGEFTIRVPRARPAPAARATPAAAPATAAPHVSRAAPAEASEDDVLALANALAA